MSYGGNYGTTRANVGTLSGAGSAPPNILGWDSDLVDKADLLSRLEWDAGFASGCTQVQAEAALIVAGGDLEVDTGPAVAAGANTDFKARWFLTPKVLPQCDADLRMDLGANMGNDFGAPFGRVTLAWFYFLNSAAASPSTPGDFGTYTDDWLGWQVINWTLGNFLVARGIWDSTPASVAGPAFHRSWARVNRQIGPSGAADTLLRFESGVDYNTTSLNQSEADASRARNTKFDDARRVRYGLAIDPDGGADMGNAGGERINFNVPRVLLQFLNP